MKKKLERIVKEWYCEQLRNNGFESVEIKKTPADIKATKNGETWWFEIKYTTKKDKYYGGSTETEWEQAFADPDHFRFVVIKTDKAARNIKLFKEFEPKDFIRFCKVPPFLITFTIPFVSPKRINKQQAEEVKSIDFSKEVFDEIHHVLSKTRDSSSSFE